MVTGFLDNLPRRCSIAQTQGLQTALLADEKTATHNDKAHETMQKQQLILENIPVSYINIQKPHGQLFPHPNIPVRGGCQLCDSRKGEERPMCIELAEHREVCDDTEPNTAHQQDTAKCSKNTGSA